MMSWRAAGNGCHGCMSTREYVFDTEEGQRTLGDLFAGRSQLLVYHFMFGPTWTRGVPSAR